MDRKFLIAMGISMAIWMAWSEYYIKPRMKKPASSVSQTTTSSVVGSGTPSLRSGDVKGTKSTTTNTAGLIHEAFETFQGENAQGKFEIRLGNGRYFVEGWKSELEHKTTLQAVTHVEGQGQGEFAFDRAELADVSKARCKLERVSGHEIRCRYEDARIVVERVFQNSGDPTLLLGKLSFQFKSQRPSFVFLSLLSQSSKEDPEAQDRQVSYYSQTSVNRVGSSDAKPIYEIPDPVKWISVSSRYFVLSLLRTAHEPKGLIQQVLPGQARISLAYPVTADSFEIPFQMYFGPKELGALRAVDPTLEMSVDFGMFTWIAYPILKLMKWIYSFTMNYGIAIILLTILIKILLFPLTFYSMKSMKGMAKIQPQLNALREKYKDDKEALNREMLVLMRSNGYNPVAGCLPILLQMPIFFALYRVLYSSIELFEAPFMGWILDLSAKDPYYVTPVILTLTMWLQQKLTPTTATDPLQQKMFHLMPVFFGLFMLTLPSGLTLYMLVNAVMSILQQLLINRVLDGNPTGTPKPLPA
jgi:YidC/Oxa1 family membrane protein insertase